MDGEIILPGAENAPLAVQLQRAEVDRMVATAKQYPRSLTKAKAAILSLVNLDHASAEECMYALPRDGKPIQGPSVRFAEALKQAYGNCAVASRVVHVDRAEMYVEAEALFIDYESNSTSTQRIRRSIRNKYGKCYSEDMIIVTGNAACAIAKRNAILEGVPKPIWREAFEKVRSVIAGDVTTLTTRREIAVKEFANFGAKPEQVCAAIGRAGVDDITLDDMITLRGMFSALKSGESSAEEMFNMRKSGPQHDKLANALGDDAPPPDDDGRE